MCEIIGLCFDLAEVAHKQYLTETENLKKYKIAY